MPNNKHYKWEDHGSTSSKKENFNTERETKLRCLRKNNTLSKATNTNDRIKMNLNTEEDFIRITKALYQKRITYQKYAL